MGEIWLGTPSIRHPIPFTLYFTPYTHPTPQGGVPQQSAWSRRCLAPRQPPPALQGPGFRLRGSGSRVQGPGFRVQGSGFRPRGVGCRLQGAGFRLRGVGSRVRDSWGRVQGAGCKMQQKVVPSPCWSNDKKPFPSEEGTTENFPRTQV